MIAPSNVKMKYEDVVPAGETGAVRGDGSGRRRFDTTPKPAAHNVTTNAGRHHTGEALANVGSIRGGQGPSGSGVGTGVNVKSGVARSSPSRSMDASPYIPANQAETSRDLEKRLLMNPQPFIEGGAATLPTGTHDGSTEGIHYNVQADVNAKPQSYGTPVGVANTSEADYEAVGYTRAEIMAARGYREDHGAAGGPAGTRRQAGMPGTKSTATSRRDNARMRQEP